MLYGVFGLLAALLVLRAVNGLQEAEQRLQHTAVLQTLVRAGEIATQLALHARLPAPAATDAMAAIGPLLDLLARQQDELLALRAQVGPQRLAAVPGVAAALQDWDRAQAGLRARADALRAASGAGDPASAASSNGTDTDPTAMLRALAIQSEQAREAALVVVGTVSDRAQQRSHEMLRQSWAWSAAAMLLLLCLAPAVTEPIVRAVQAQIRGLAQQAQALRTLALVAEHTQSAVIICDRDDRVTWANAAFVRLTGWSLDAAVGRRPSELLDHPEMGEAARQSLSVAVQGGSGIRLEWLARTRDGRDLWLDCDLRPLPGAHGQPGGFVRVNNDITDRRLLQAQLRASAQTDSLTRLPNRSMVMQRLKRAIADTRQDAGRPGQGFAVLFMDFDRFKQVNDTLGHSLGDELLRQIAGRLEQTLRQGDAVGRIGPPRQMAARLGGDEFVVVLEAVRSATDAELVADRLQQALRQPYQLGAHQVQSSASIGIVVRTGDEAVGALGDVGDEAEAVLRDADTAMYEAKRQQRGSWVMFSPAMQERVVHVLGVERDLRQALAERQLSVVYQPVVRLDSGAVAGVEALVRWQHPQRGLVSPAEFIAVAEECGLIDAIGAFVMQAACAQFMVWRRELGERAPPMLAVNLSSAQLQVPGLEHEVQRVLNACGMPAAALQLEVTESLAAQGPQVQATLRALKALGVKLALDDFGTGYSSLACLDQLPVDTVKIDRAFVAHAANVEYRRVLIEATVRVARSLGMTTVAEGIETPAQARQMTELQCGMGQGFHFGRPMAEAELRRWLVTAPHGAARGAATEAVDTLR